MNTARIYGIQAPDTVAHREPPPRCCAKCKRGTEALRGPCGFEGVCSCHGIAIVEATCPSCHDVLGPYGCVCTQGRAARLAALKARL